MFFCRYAEAPVVFMRAYLVPSGAGANAPVVSTTTPVLLVHADVVPDSNPSANTAAKAGEIGTSTATATSVVTSTDRGLLRARILMKILTVRSGVAEVLRPGSPSITLRAFVEQAGI